MILVKQLFNQPILSFLFLCISNTDNVQIHIEAPAPETVEQPVENQQLVSNTQQDLLIKKTMSLIEYFFFSLIQLIVGSVSSLLISFFWQRKSHYLYKTKKWNQTCLYKYLTQIHEYKYFCHIENSTNFYETMAYFFIMCLSVGFFVLHTYCLKKFNIPVGFSFFYFLSSFPFCLRKKLSFFLFLSFFNPICFSHQTKYSIKYIAISLHDKDGTKKAKITTKETANHFMKCYFLIMLFFILIQLFIISERKSYNIFFVFPNFVLFLRLCFFNFNFKNEHIFNTRVRISLIDTDQKKQTIGKISVLMCSPKKGKNWDTPNITIEHIDNFIKEQESQPQTLFLKEITQFQNPEGQFHLIFRDQSFDELFGIIKGKDQYTDENIEFVSGSYRYKDNKNLFIY